MSKPIRLIAVLLICAVLLPAAGSPFPSASAAPLATSPDLGTAQTFAILGGSTVTNTGLSSVTGDLGVSPGTAVTGFGGPPGGTVIGTIYPGGDVAAQAQLDVTAAYNALGPDRPGQECTTNYGSTQDLVNLDLGPGVYCAGEFALSGTLTLTGNATDVWIFRSTSTLVTSAGAGGTPKVILSGGGTSCNVWWRAENSATLGTDTVFAGNILAAAAITMNGGATLEGRALAKTAVTMISNTISDCSGPTAIAMRDFQATSATGSPIGLGAGAGLLLALGLIVVRRRAPATPGAAPSARQGQGK